MRQALFAFSFLLFLLLSPSFAAVNETNASRLSVIEEKIIAEKATPASDAFFGKKYPLLATARLGGLQPLLEMLEPYSRLLDYALMLLGVMVVAGVAYRFLW